MQFLNFFLNHFSSLVKIQALSEALHDLGTFIPGKKGEFWEFFSLRGRGAIFPKVNVKILEKYLLKTENVPQGLKFKINLFLIQGVSKRKEGTISQFQGTKSTSNCPHIKFQDPASEKVNHNITQKDHQQSQSFIDISLYAQ